MTCRLLFSIARYFEYGGLQRDMLNIAAECTRRGHDVDILTGAWVGATPASVRVTIVPLRAISNFGKNNRLAEAVRCRLRQRTYDCSVGFNKISGLDIYYAGDTCLAEKWRLTKSKAVRRLPRYAHFLKQERDVFAHGGTTEILLIAHQEKDRFIQHYGTEASRFHLLPPGINRDRLRDRLLSESDKLKIRGELGVSPDDTMILMVGSGFRTKGIDRSLRALHSLREPLRSRCKLVIAGKGKARPLQILARKLGISGNVIFTGARDDVGRLYQTADILLHPAYSENTGTALLEAMVCGLPVLTTANCGYARHVEDADAGIVCPQPFSQKHLDRSLLEMLTCGRADEWRRNADSYCRETDIYSLFNHAADAIIARAERNKEER